MPSIASPYVSTTGRYIKGRFDDLPTYPPVTQTLLNPVGMYKFDQKSPLVKNPKGAYGWRSPSSYYRKIEDRQEFFGDALIWQASNSQFDGYRKFSGFIGGVAAQLPSAVYSYDSPSSNDVARCRVKVLNKLKSQNVNYAVALAEAAKSASMIQKTALELLNAYRFARAGKWRRSLGFLGISKHKFHAPSKEFSRRWLEVSYGWLPLLSDIYGAYEDARGGLLGECRLSVKHTVKSQQPVIPPSVNSYGVRVFTQQSDRSCYGVKIRLDYTLRNDALKLASQIGIVNPALVAWELVPFSFVGDWVVPISEWLSCFDADFGLDFKAGSETSFVFLDRIQTASCINQTRSPNAPGLVDAQASINVVEVARTALNSTPFPTPYWKSPISGRHAMSALALLRGFVKSF